MNKKRHQLLETELKEADFEFSQNFHNTSTVISDTTTFSGSNQAINSGPVYKLYNYRIVILVLFCMILISMGMMMVSFSTAAIQIANILDCDTYIITMCMGVYMAVSAVFAVPANYMNDKYGIHFGIYIGVSIFIIGAWLRLFITNSVYFTLLGSMMGGIAFCFANAPAKIAAVWFGSKESAMCISIMTAMVPFGCMIGFFLPSIFIDSDILSKFKERDVEGQYSAERERGIENIHSLILFQNCLFSVVVGLVFIFWRKKPPSPPSPSSTAALSTSCVSAIKDLCGNKNFVFLVACFNIVWGVYGTMGALVSLITLPYGFDATQNSVFTLCFTFCGLVGSFFIARTVDKRKIYRKVHITLSFLLIVMIMCTQLAFQTRNLYVVMLAIGLFGVTVLPFLPLSYSYGAQLTYPLGPATMGGLLIGTSQFSAVMILLTVQYLLKIDKYFGIIFLLGVTSISFGISLFIQEDLAKERADSIASDDNSSQFSESMVELKLR